jgi:hypothetical protein
MKITLPLWSMPIVKVIYGLWLDFFYWNYKAMLNYDGFSQDHYLEMRRQILLIIGNAKKSNMGMDAHIDKLKSLINDTWV